MQEDVETFIKRLRDEADLCRNETANDSAKLLDDAAHWLVLMTAGREQDQFERKLCIATLDAIAMDYEWLSRDDMISKARRTLVDVGAWQKIEPPIVRVGPERKGT